MPSYSVEQVKLEHLNFWSERSQQKPVWTDSAYSSEYVYFKWIDFCTKWKSEKIQICFACTAELVWFNQLQICTQYRHRMTKVCYPNRRKFEKLMNDIPLLHCTYLQLIQNLLKIILGKLMFFLFTDLSISFPELLSQETFLWSILVQTWRSSKQWP